MHYSYSVFNHAMAYLFSILCLFIHSPLGHSSTDQLLSLNINGPVLVSKEALDSKINDAESNSDLDETTRERLIEYYRRAIRNLEVELDYKASAEFFIRAKKSDPEQIEYIKRRLSAKKTQPTKAILNGISASKPLPVLEQQLFTERANLSAIKVKRSDLEQQLLLIKAKPNELQQRLIEVNRLQTENTNRILYIEAEREQPIITQAIRWMLETKLSALRSEIFMLDKELLSLPFRMELLELGLKWHDLSIENLSKRIALLQKMVNRKRQVETDQAREQAESAKLELAEKHTLIQQLVKENQSLTEELSRITSQLDDDSFESDLTAAENERMQNQLKNIRMKLEVGGYETALGKLLIELYRQLPGADEIKKRKVLRKKMAAEMSLRQLEYSEEIREINTIDEYINRFTTAYPKQDVDKIRDDLKTLAFNRKELLEQLKKQSSSYIRLLNDYNLIDQAALDTIQNCHEFINRNLFWVRSSPLPSLTGLKELPTRLAWMASPSLWGQASKALLDLGGRSILMPLGLLFIVLIFLKVKTIRKLLSEQGENVGKIAKDKISTTFYALLLTIFLAALWPLLLSLLAWQLKISLLATTFTHSLSEALQAVVWPLFILLFFRISCEKGGLASKHFKMQDTTAGRLHKEFSWFMGIFLPAQFFFVLIYSFDLAESTGEAGRILIAVGLVSLTVFLYRLVPVLKNTKIDEFKTGTTKWQIIKDNIPHILIITFFLGLMGLDLLGYIYTAGFLTMRLVYTLCFVAGLVLARKTAVRWLRLTQRRLAWQTAIEKRSAEKLKRIGQLSEQPEVNREVNEVEEPEIDFAELSQESLYLLNVTLVILGLVGVLGIWAEILPAFNMLDEITLWSQFELVSGEKRLVPVTLLDLGLALLIVFATFFTTKYLPSLLEIIMLQRTTLTAGSRYTVKTVTNYTILAVGTVMFFNLIGVDWSKVQWLIAALGVGIGFGLQEIVANFISGIIILFERPIRVGDVVTIGNHDGTVTRIRIRATTIRDWDRKELLVPNKELITGQLINWTLSDTTIRLVIPVGLAYGGDVEKALMFMLEAAKENPDVLSEPAPSVVFDGFGDNALSLKLRCFIPDIDFKVPTLTELHKEINRKFNDDGLIFAFPQQDMHLDTTAPLDVRLLHQSSANNDAAVPSF